MTRHSSIPAVSAGHRVSAPPFAAVLRAKVAALARLVYDVPWCVPPWGWAELAATIGAFATGRIVRGRAAEQFAEATRRFLNVSFALPVNRGRTAIELALLAMGVGHGDDVILPSYVCSSVLEAVTRVGATPVFADIDETLNLTAASIKAALTTRTKCVIVAHLYGRAAAIDEIEQLLRANDVRLIDDAAQAIGARCGPRLVGSFGDCGVVSCGPGKPLAGAAGGVLVTNDRDLYRRAAAISLEEERLTAVAGRTIGFWIWRRARRFTLPVRAVIDVLRGNPAEPPSPRARMSNVEARIALSQLEAIEQHAAARRSHARILITRLATLRGTLVTDLTSAGMAVKLVSILPSDGVSASDAVRLLARHGIEAQAGFTPLHRSDAETDARLATTMALRDRILTVPLDTRPRRTEPIVVTPELS